VTMILPTNGDWYAVCDLPGVTLKVRVIWNRQTFVAAHLKTFEGWLWARQVDGAMERLPPSRRASIWGPEPDRWQPEEAATFVWPKGVRAQPLPQAVLMVADSPRACIVRRRDDGGVAGQARLLWWLDRSAVRTNAALTERGVEGRLMRALASDGFGPVRAANGLRLSGLLVSLAATFADIEQPGGPGDDHRGPVFVADPLDQDDYLIAMSWMRGLEPSHARVLYLASRLPALTWGTVAKRLSLRKGEAAVIVYTAALAAAYRHATIKGCVPSVGTDAIAM